MSFIGGSSGEGWFQQPHSPTDPDERRLAITVETLEARGYPRTTEAQRALDLLCPAGKFLIGMHFLEDGLIIWDGEGLRITFTLDYRVDAEDDLGPPVVIALPPLVAESPLSLTFFLSRPLIDRYVEDLAAGTEKFGLATTIQTVVNAQGGAQDDDGGR